MPVQPRNPAPDRRTLLAGLAGAGVAVPLVAACGSGQDASGGGASTGGTPSGGKSAGGNGGGGGGGGGKVLASTSEIPVGGGKIFAQQQLVVTQPKHGEFKCFSAVCTHQGCLVNKVSGSAIDCPCHGSQFSIGDGSVVGGPAPQPLAAEKIQVKGDKIILG